MKGLSKNQIAIFILGLTLFAGCKGREEESDDLEVKTAVKIVSPTYHDIQEYVTLNGVTLFQKKNNIRSTNTGFITSMNFKPGDEIHYGDVFCTLVTKEQEAIKNISTIDTSLSKFSKPIPVFANGSGVITSISVLQGDYISEGDALATFSVPSSLIIQVNVPYEYNNFVKAGKECEIILPDGKIIHSSISGEMPTVDPSSQAQSFYIRLSDQKLPENLNVILHISKEQKKNLLCLPSTVIQTNDVQNEYWVMKIVNDSIAVKIPVVTGLQDDSLTEIVSGKINPGDKIISEGAYGLADSAYVTFQGQ